MQTDIAKSGQDRTQSYRSAATIQPNRENLPRLLRVSISDQLYTDLNGNDWLLEVQPTCSRLTLHESTMRSNLVVNFVVL